MLTPLTIYGALMSASASGPFAFAGVAYERLAQGLASALFSWGINQPQNLALTGLVTGTTGAGTILPFGSKITLVANPAAVQAGLTGAGMAGPLAGSLAVVVASGLAQAFTSSGQYQGVSATVAVGTDVSKVTVANTASLVGILNSTLAATCGSGPALPMMASGLGVGITNLLLLATGTAAVTGVPTVPPAVATGATTAVVV
jgi:hypothetical protein